MGKNEIILLIYGIICCLFSGQLGASGNIGNRSYSSWYETHCLVERKGIFALIFYQPKHFGRYTLYEVVYFFASFLLPVAFAVCAVLLCWDILSGSVYYGIVIASSCLLYFCQFIIVIINDVGSHKDEKIRFYLESGERNQPGKIDDLTLPSNVQNSKMIHQIMTLHLQTRNQPYFTIYNLRDSYHQRIKQAKGDPAKIEKVNKEYIAYFRNIDHLIVIKENKDGSLIFKQ